MKNFKQLLILAVLAIFGFGQVWGAETLVYTLDGTIAGSGTAYASENDITQSNKAWKVMGNTTTNPWRIGGKGLTGADRIIYNVTNNSFSDDICKVTIDMGATASSLTVNSITLIVSTAQNGGGTVTNTETKTSNLTSTTLTFNRPSEQDWSNKYFKIVINVTRTSTSGNGYVAFNNAKFYKTATKTLSSVAVSGTPDEDTYEEGDVFDVTGLTVTGTYSDASFSAISEGITWKARTSAQADDEVALANYHLTQGQTSLQVQATVSEIASAWYTVSGLTVNEHVVTPGKYDLILANAFWGTSGTGANAGHTASGKQNDISVSIAGSSGTQNYINDSETRVYGSHTITFSVPSGFVLKEITGLGTESKSDIAVATGSTGTITTRVWSGSTQSVTFNVGGRTDFTTVSVTYAADVKYAVSFSAPTGGTLVIKDGDDAITSGDEFDEDKTLTVTVTPDGTHIGGTIAVAKTVGGDDVTASVLSGTTLTVPAYAITVSATFTPTYSITKDATGGSVALEDENGAPITGRVAAGTEIIATATADGSHVFESLSLSDNVTVSDIDDNVAMFTMPAGDVTITATFTDKPCTKLGTPANVIVGGTSYPYNAATLNWDDVSYADAYEVTIKKAGVTVERDIVEESEYSFSTTLLANTEYSYEIVATSNDAVNYCASEAKTDNFSTTDYPSVTVTYSENGNTDNTASKQIMKAFKLPTSAAECSKTFVGWTTKSDFVDGNENLNSYYAKGADFTITSNAAITLYAVYATEGSGDAEEVLNENFASISTGNSTESSGSGTAWTPNSNFNSTKNAVYQAGGAIRLGKSGSITTKALDLSSGAVTVSFKLKGWSASENTITVQVDNQDTQNATCTGYMSTGDFESKSLTFAAGTEESVVKFTTSSSVRVFVDDIVVSVEGEPTYSEYAITCAEQLAAPTGLTAGTYYAAQTITLAATNDAAIYYSLDGNVPTIDAQHLYSEPFTLSERAVVTVKAIAVKQGFDNSEVASATYNINLPYNFADFAALTKVDGTEYAVRGIISQKGTLTANNQLPYWISADGSTTGQIKCHNGLKLNKETFTSADDVNLGDNVTVVGTWSTQYSNLNAGNWMLEYTARAAANPAYEIVGDLTANSFNEGEAFSDAILANLSVNALFTNGYKEAVDGVTFTCGEKTTWSSSDETLTVTAVKNEENLVSRDFGVTVTSATLVSIALKADDADYQTKKVYYLGDEFVAPTIVATLSDETTTEAVATYVSGFDNANAGAQTVFVSYTRGAITEQTSYSITMKDYANDVDHPYTVAEAIDIIANVIGTTASERNIYVQGIVSQKSNPSSNAQTYYISDNGTTTNHLEIYKGKYIGGANFTNANQVLVGDEVVVGGKVKMFNTQAEFDEGSTLQSLARTPNFEIADVASFEVGAEDLAVSDLTVTKDGEGAITLVSGDEAKATIVANAIHAVAPGTVTITANLAASGIYKAVSTTFEVTVVPLPTKYAISFDSNGADGGDAPEAIADKKANEQVTLPANTWTKDGYAFDGWKVTNNTTSAQITVTDGKFTMPASAVTIQAQWAEISEWADIYTSESGVTLSTTGGTSASEAKVVYNATQYDAIKAGTGSVYGAIKVTVPAQASKLHYHAYGWNSETVTLNITAPAGVTVSPASQAINSNSGISSSTPFTLSAGADPKTDAYYVVALSGNTEEATLTFTATGGKRFVLFGVNQEGGVLPVLDHITISGELTNKDYELGDNLNTAGLTVTAYYTLAGVAHHNEDVTSQVQWSNDPLTGGQTSVDVTATYEGKTDTKACAINAVVVPAPEILVSESAIDFKTVAKDASVASESVSVTLKNVAEAEIAISGAGASAFSVDKASLTATGSIAISANTAVAGTYAATVTVSDKTGAAEAKEIVLSMTVVDVPYWATVYRSNVNFSGTGSVEANSKVVIVGKQYKAKKVGAGSAVGAVTVEVPKGAHTLHFHAAAWNNADATIAISGVTNASQTSFNVEKDAGVKNSGTYTLANVPFLQYHSFTFDEVAENTTITFSRTDNSDYRFVIYGANQEGGVWEVKTNENASALPDNADVVLEGNTTLTIDEEKTLGSLTAKEGTKVAVNNPMTVQTFSICATVGGTGSSGEADIQAAVTADEIHADIRLAADDNNTFQNQWHSFTVPFPVDAMNGIYDTLDNKLGNEVNYAIMDYHGDVRATGGYGWKKYRGVLVPGTFYLITVDANTRVLRMKKTATGAVKAGNSIAMKYWGDGDNTNTNNGWCGVGNQNWFGGYVPYAVQVLNSAGTGYEILSANSAKFSACIPFFIQIASDATLTVSADLPSPVAARRAAAKRVEDIKITFGNDEYKDRLYISASEDAKNEYEIGKDLVKMIMSSTPSVAQIFGKAYGNKLCMVYAPMSDDKASYDLTLYVPANGEYVMSAPETEDADVYLTKDGMITWNLSMSECTLELNKGNNEGYGLLLVKKAPSVATGIENGEVLNGANGVQKVIIDEHVYILRDGKMYGVDGKKIK